MVSYFVVDGPFLSSIRVIFDLYLVAIDHPHWAQLSPLIRLVRLFLDVLQNGGLGRPMGHMRLHNQSSLFCTRFSCDSDRWWLPFCS